MLQNFYFSHPNIYKTSDILISERLNQQSKNWYENFKIKKKIM